MCFTTVLLLLPGCTAPTKAPSESAVRIAIAGEPDKLNPITYRTVNALSINSLIFQKLLDVDYHTLQLTPVLATAKPTINQTADSLYMVKYKIRPEAKWNNGTPITSRDVLFTMKLGVLPNIANEGKKEYLSCIRDIQQDPENPQSITFICSPSMRIEYATGAELGIMPKYHYDPENLLTNITFSDLVNNQLDSAQHNNISTWAKTFDTPKFQRTKEGVSGSGPYALADWQSEQKIVLERKNHFWAENINASHTYFDNFPSKITYFILTEPTAIVGAAKNNQIDIGPIVRSTDYQTLRSDSSFLKKFEILLAPELSTNVILVNGCRPELASIKTRKALALLFDAPQYIESVQKSTGERVTGFLHPTKEGYNKDIHPYPYDPQQASALLKEDGWLDSDNNGILDKTIDGKFYELRLEYKYNTGHEGRKNAGLLYKEWARAAGVEIHVTNEEWLVFIESLMNDNFDLAFFSWTDEHAPTDPTTLFHSSAIKGGYNFGCYSSAVADSLMDVMATTTDPNQRRKQWHLLHETLHNEVASIFVSNNKTRLFVSRKFAPVKPSSQTPGYWAGSLKAQ